METPVSKQPKMTGPTSLAELLRRSERLRGLRAQAEERRRLTGQIRALLPAAEAAHLLAAYVSRSAELVLVLDSPAWAARVRYAQDRLLAAVQPLAITRIRIQARPRR